ncbi:uncharacterized protein LOC106165216 [Lingula anatina]|uniref:Uncharacterized protein LOC106165216 n=1 Tax=Lingula anatina TaxID=7574 RepID=A0A1S3IKP1_LINAN|nr:uncharacterized protein LOC106165216 [Lingula anatina]|eukprot:XP_013398782.1 uncharacterized protein LOC106165216 [Lingula anatina]
MMKNLIAVLFFVVIGLSQQESISFLRSDSERRIFNRKIRTVFRRLDTDGNGVISRSDFEAVAEKIIRCHPDMSEERKDQIRHEMTDLLWEQNFAGGYDGEGPRPPITLAPFVDAMYEVFANRRKDERAYRLLFAMYAEVHTFMEFDGREGVSLYDYEQWMKCQHPQIPQFRLIRAARGAFQLLDRDQNGLLDEYDFLYAVQKFYTVNTPNNIYNNIVYGPLVE